MKLNLKNAKKVAQDNKSTTFSLGNGNKIIVAHEKLNPQLRSELAALPLHMAEGGMASSNNQNAAMKENYGNKKRVKRYKDGGDTDESGSSGAPDPVAVQSTVEADGQSPAAVASPIASSDTAPTIVPQTPDEHKQLMLNNYQQQDAAWAQDLKNGHVTPETYGSLFAKKDTLGKIGSIFGMMMSGAGSGLAHQQNAYTHMLDQQISNDLQAQTTSKTNAQNFIKLNLQHQMQQAQIEQLVKQGTLTDAQAKSAMQDISIKANTFARQQMNRAALTHLVKQVNNANLPPEQRAQAQQQLQTMGMMVDAENYKLSDAAAAKSAFLNQNNFGPTQAPNPNSPVDYDKMNKEERASQLKIPGSPTSEDIGHMTKEATGLEETRALRNDFDSGYEALDKMFLAGKLSPNARDSYVQSLAGKLAKASAGRYNQAEATNQINSMVPAYNDWGATREIRRSNNGKFFDILEAGTPTLNRFGLKNAPPTRAPAPAPETKVDRVNVMDPSGKLHSVPKSQLDLAIKKGYKQQ